MGTTTGGGDGGGGWNRGLSAPHLIGNKRAMGYRHTDDAKRRIGAASRGNKHAAGKPAHNRSAVPISCSVCGREIMVIPSRHGRTKCCSWECRSKWMSDRMKILTAKTTHLTTKELHDRDERRRERNRINNQRYRAKQRDADSDVTFPRLLVVQAN